MQTAMKLPIMKSVNIYIHSVAKGLPDLLEHSLSSQMKTLDLLLGLDAYE